MKIDLCKLFGVEEGEEFEFNKYKGSRYKVSELGCLKFLTDKGWVDSAFEFNEAIGCEIIKLPKKKQFTDDELCILRNIDKDYKCLKAFNEYSSSFEVCQLSYGVFLGLFINVYIPDHFLSLSLAIHL